MFLTFTPGLFQTLGVPNTVLKLVQESYIFLLFVFSLKGLTIKPKYTVYVIAYMLISFFSSMMNDQDVLTSILYSRFHLYAFLIFLISKSYNWTKKEITSQFKFLKFLLIIQVLFAVYEIFIIRRIEEEIVGTISISGGELATVLPLAGLCFIFVEYLYTKNIKWLLLSISLILIGFASGKRGVIFYFPLTLLFVYFSYVKFQNISKAKYVPKLLFLSFFALGIFLIGTLNNESLRTDNKYLNSQRNALSYASEYTNARSYDGYIIGRTGASSEVLRRTGSNGFQDLLGFGPLTLMGNSGDFFYYNIDYGIVGWSKEVISVGWLGMIAYLLLYVSIYRGIRKRKNSFRNTFLAPYFVAVKSFYVVFIVIFFTYSVSFSTSGVAAFYFMIFSGILYSSESMKDLKKGKI